MAKYPDLGLLIWSPVAGGFLSGKYERGKPAPAGTRFNENGNFVPFDKETGYNVVDAAKGVATRHGVSVARVALAWLLAQDAVTSVIIAGRKKEHLADNIAAVDLTLTDQDLADLDQAGHPGYPYPQWMVMQLDVAEDPRPKALYPERYENGSPWEDRRDYGWEG